MWIDKYMRVLWSLADQNGEIPSDRWNEVVARLSQISYEILPQIRKKLQTLEEAGFIKTFGLADSFYTQILKVLSGYGTVVEGEKLKEALAELSAAFNVNLRWLQHVLRQMEELGYLKVELRKWNRLHRVVVLKPPPPICIRLLSEFGKPRPPKTPEQLEREGFVRVKDVAGKEFWIKSPP